MAPVILGYWDIRGLAQPIRYLLEHAGVEYQEKLYPTGGPPDFNRSEWHKEKADNQMGLDFPNLPYLIDGDIKLTQSHVILRYLARKHNLAGANETERVRADLLAAQAYDYHMDYAKVAYNPDFLRVKDDYNKTLPDKMKLLTNCLGSRKFAAGDSVTYADFVLFEYLEGQRFFNPEFLKDFPVLEQYCERVLALEGVDKYYKSPKAIKFPFNWASARFGGAYSDQLLKQ